MVLNSIHLLEQADAVQADKCSGKKRKSDRVQTHKYEV